MDGPLPPPPLNGPVIKQKLCLRQFPIVTCKSYMIMNQYGSELIWCTKYDFMSFESVKHTYCEILRKLTRKWIPYISDLGVSFYLATEKSSF